MELSYGFVETQGLIGSIEAADAMVKTANVHLVEKREIGFGLVTIIVEGELGAVHSAVDAGVLAAKSVGQFITSHIIPRPFNDTQMLVSGDMQNLQKPETIEKEIEKPKVKVSTKSKKVKGFKIDKEILNFLEKEKAGATLNQITERCKSNIQDVRIVLKKLIDTSIIEKVQQKYYLL